MRTNKYSKRDTCSLPRVVVPGEAIGVMEEFLPGEGVYVDAKRGFLRAYYVGKPRVNPESKLAVLEKPLKKPVLPKQGDIIIGVITSLRDEIGVVDIVMRRDGTSFSGTYSGIIHVSQVSQDYVGSLHEVYKAGDVILARILNSGIPYQLTTASANLGAILSFCSYCGHVLEKKPGNILVCSRCGNREKRKISIHYGELRIRV